MKIFKNRHEEDFSEQEDTMNEVPRPKTVHAHLSKRALAVIFVAIFFFSSFFGAIFGFFSAGVVSFFAPNISRKISQAFPNFNAKILNPETSKQQVIVEDSAVIDVVGKSSPAVVSIMISKDVSTIQNTQNNQSGLFDPFSLPPLGGNGSKNQSDGKSTQKQIIGSASGFLITTDGLVLTNKHVVDDTQATYTVVTNDSKQYPTKILATDPVRDVAVLKIEGNNFPTLPLGNSDALRVGQTVIAIGDSLGEFSNSVSRGIVSGLKRNVNADSGGGDAERLTNIIQTDAAINPGNSGGPLLDIDGKVIGINVARAQGAENVGFALPINQVKRIIDQVENGTRVSVPYLGIRYIVIDQIVQMQAQLPFDYGVLVARGNNVTDLAVMPGSPADIAGIVENDIILEINGEKITKDDQLSDIIAKYKVGDTIVLKVWHKGQTKEVSVTLQELKQ